VSSCDGVAPALAEALRARDITVNGLAPGLEPPGAARGAGELVALLDGWSRVHDSELEVSMSTTKASAAGPDFKLEVVVLPVSDVDRAKRFYAGLGWREDADVARGDDFRVVQMTPPGSPASVIFGTGVTSAEPGSIDGLVLVVEDAAAARAELVARGVDASEVFHDAGGVFHHAGTKDRVPGPAPDHGSYGSWVSFSDPDGNVWMLQEITTRLPGRVATDVGAVAALLQETSIHHGRFEAVTPPHDWWDWYAAYFSARQAGSTPDESDAAADRYMKEVHGIVPK
jgi:catechol 2,3-dioxygenase-like lactoylglutathione lyase family enzyme